MIIYHYRVSLKRGTSLIPCIIFKFLITSGENRCWAHTRYLSQEHKVSYWCSLPSPLQKRSKDFGLGGSASFELLSFPRLWQNFCQNQRKLWRSKLFAILYNPWISSAMTMAMSINRTLCVLVSTQAPPVVPVINIGGCAQQRFSPLVIRNLKIMQGITKIPFFRDTL